MSKNNYTQQRYNSYRHDRPQPKLEYSDQDRDRYRNLDQSNSSTERDRYRDNGGDRNRYNERDRYNDSDNGRDRYRDNGRDNGRDRYRDNDRDNGGDRNRYNDRDNGRDRYRDNDRDNGRDRYRDNDRDNGRDRYRDNGGDRNRYNDRNRYSDRNRDNEGDRDNDYNRSTEQRDNRHEEEQLITKMQELSVEDIARREEYSTSIATFEDLSSLIDLKLIRGVVAYGFENPSPIQQKAIKPLLGGYDVIAQAQSGTGKTATFCIGVLGNIDYTKNETQAIVLGHTMELAQQIEIVFKNIGKYLDLRIGQAIKSIPVRENIDQLLGRGTEGLLPHVVIGTPGRMLDMLNKGVINNNTVKMLILDEADELLSIGFVRQIESIIRLIGGSKLQIGLFSATMEPAFFKITQEFMRHPLNILIKKEELTLEGIKQYYVNCEKNEYKIDTLIDLYSIMSISQTIIYCNHYQSVEHLTKKLQDENFKVSYIHGNMSINEREEAMRNFRNMVSRVLISTDLLGRGIDVQQVSVVINYDIPLKIENYIHRIGRSGRHGRKGTAINLVNTNDFKRMQDIEKYYNTVINELPANFDKVLRE